MWPWMVCVAGSATTTIPANKIRVWRFQSQSYTSQRVLLLARNQKYKRSSSIRSYWSLISPNCSENMGRVGVLLMLHEKEKLDADGKILGAREKK